MDTPTETSCLATNYKGGGEAPVAYLVYHYVGAEGGGGGGEDTKKAIR